LKRYAPKTALAAALFFFSFALAPAGARGPESLAELAAEVSDAVVNISAEIVEPKRGRLSEPNTPSFDEYFDDFLRRQQKLNPGLPEPPQERHGAMGSGFVIDPSGIIVTNNHVIAGANEITVNFTDGQKLKAEIIGKDEKVDVAVLRVKPEKSLKAVKFGDSEKSRVGDWVLAVGNPFGLGGSVSAGIISARNRNIDKGPYDSYIQTDAAINKGNSGGPMFNMDGEVIGINTAILSPSGNSIGIGFATPANTVAPVIEQLQKFGEARRGWLGVRVQGVDDAIAETLGFGTRRGALVAAVDERGPSKAADVKIGDLIVKFDGKPIKDPRDLPKVVALTPVGKPVEIVVIRDGKEQARTVTVARLEESEKSAAADASSKLAEKPPAALGLEFGKLSEELRTRYQIKEAVKAGAVILSVDPKSDAAEKHLRAGEIVTEINQEPVADPAEAVKKITALKDAGKKSALFIVANGRGDTRFVAVPLGE